LSAVQVWRGPRPALVESTSKPLLARSRRPLRSWHLPLALLAASPVIAILGWLWLDSPAVFERFAGRFLLATILLVLLTSLCLRSVRRRNVDDLRSLHRVVRRIETGDFEGALPRFDEPEIGRVAAEAVEIGRRMRLAEEQILLETDRSRRDRLRQESVLESVESENARLRAEASVLHGFGGVLNRSLGPPQICSELITNIKGKVEFACAIVYLLEDNETTLAPQALCDPEHPLPLAGNFLKDTPAGLELSTRTVAGWVAQTGKMVRVDDTLTDSRCVEIGQGMRSVLAVPLRARQSAIGVIQLEHPHPYAYNASDERILASLANQAAIAVENVRLFDEAAKVQALRELDRLKSELLSTVSHELRTPLASIKGYAGTLLRDDVEWDDATRREFLQIIDEESDRLGELIEDLLQMSQIEAGILRVNPVKTRLPRLAQRVAKKARSNTSGHHINATFPSDFPEVLADPRRLEQVLRNLVENAVKYSPDGGTVTVRGDVVGGEAVISISDEGIGIAPEDLAHVFDRFYRADGQAVRRAGGTGLGLSICQGIVQMHGGRIWAASTPGAGSTFHFTLPLVDPIDPTASGGELQEEPA
jgi:signal transduction histidine kinase/HAMP domain-containing protein